MSKSNRSTVRRASFGQVLATNLRILALFAGGGALLFILYAIVLPKKYQASTTVLPPERQGVGGMLSSFLSNSPILDLLKGEGAQNPTTDLFKTIIDSRSVAEEVARDSVVNTYLAGRFHLEGGTSDSTIQLMADIVRGAMTSESLRTGQFIVTVTMATPRLPSTQQTDSTRIMSAYISNRYIQALDRFNRDRLMTSARGTRIFIEGEYNKRMAQLDSAYKHLQDFQEGHQAIALPEQLSATVTAAAKLTGEIQKLEMAVHVEEREMGPNSPTIKTLTAELDEAKAQLQKYDDGGAGEYILALKSAPELTRAFAGLLREVKVLEQVSAYLRSELEQQRIAEQRDLPSLQVLDPAQPPAAHSGMGRFGFGIIGMLAGAIVGLIAIYTKRYIRDVRERPQVHYRIINLIRTVRNGEHATLIAPLDAQSTDVASAERFVHTASGIPRGEGVHPGPLAGRIESQS